MRFKASLLEQGSREWLDFRRDKIGASEIASILGVEGAYSKRSDVLYEKQTGIAKPINSFTQALFDLGHEIESEARASYNKCFQTNFKPMVVQSIENESFFASLDGIDFDRDEILEVKSTRKEEYLKLAADSAVPEVYNVQIQWQLFITGYRSAVCLVVNSSDLTTSIVEVKRDDVLIGTIKLAADQFLKEMASGAVPYLELETQEVRNIAAVKSQIRTLRKQLDEYELSVNKQCEDLLNSFGANKITGCGLVIERLTRAGSIDYSKIEEIKGKNLEKYRRPATSYISIKEIKK